MAHARRKLFAVDAGARNAGMDETARHALREERSRPLLEILRAELEAAGRKALPSSVLGKGVNYTLSLWQKLTRFLDHPQIELSSNLAENSMRPVVLGRRTGSMWAARRRRRRWQRFCPSLKPAAG